MKGYEQYLDMYRLKARWIPRPVNDNFYPNSFVTRDEFINALLTLKMVKIKYLPVCILKNSWLFQMS